MSGSPVTRPVIDLVDGTRNALIIVSDQYDDPRLRRLRAPTSDARALAAVLQDPGIGDFEVRTLINKPAHLVNRAVEEFFLDRHADDLLLMHFSGHGIKDQEGELYLAAPNTVLDLLGATAVSAEFISRRMGRSRSKRVVLLLDCCYAGAFDRGLVARAAVEVGVEHQFSGRGRAVITASSAMEYAFEAGELADSREAPPSVFTSALVEGLETGGADRDQDGRVGLDELYLYVYDKVREATPNQTPGKWNFGMEGELYIARRSRPVTTPAALAPELRQAMESRLPGVRGVAVQELDGILHGGHAGMALAAREALEWLVSDSSRAVAAAAAAALGVAAPVLPGHELPELVLSAAFIDLGHIPQHGDSPEHQVRINNAGGGDLNARVTTSATWLKLNLVGAELTIAADTSAAGAYEGTITVDSDGGSGTIRVYALIDSAPPPTDAETTGLLPSVDRRPAARMPLPAKAMRIGRELDNDLVLSDLNVSRHHAELRKSPTGSYEIVDLGSHSGTYVNGQRVTAVRLTEQDLVGIGSSTFRLKDGELQQFVDEGDITFTARDLTVTLPSGKMLLDHVSFPLGERCLLGIIGPSGSGKSTLLGALTGLRPADTGTVLYDNRDLYQNYNEIRDRIGLVPQESVVHRNLTARRALQYAAELRFPVDTSKAERNRRVDEVLAELSLTKHAETRADWLSGGQQKRLNVALELLTKPSLLFLDEPTSGLDPGLDKSVMEMMSGLAKDGRTVIVVTHSVANLDICDRLLVLVPGGKVAYFGPPQDGLKYFGKPGWAEVFQSFEVEPGRDWAGEYQRSVWYQQYVLGQQPHLPQAQEGQELAAIPQPHQRGVFGQTAMLTRRYIRVISSERGHLITMALLPIVLGLLIHFVGSKQGLSGPPHTNRAAEQLLLMLVICACLVGAASSIRELVKERRIYIRERAAGLSAGAYLSSKLLVLGGISVVQSVVIVLIALAGRPTPPSGAFLAGAPLPELLIGVAALALASMCLGLFVSAWINTQERAVPFLVALTIILVGLSGGVLSLDGTPGLAQLSWIAPSRWGFGAIASTANLNVIDPTRGSYTDWIWTHTSSNWLRDIGYTVGLAAIFALLTWIRLRRLGSRRR